MSGFGSTIPAWRIKQLRTYLSEVGQRAASPDEDGADLEHRAARRRFSKARARSVPQSRVGKRLLPQKIIDEIWKELVPGRQRGDGSKAIHNRVVASCQKSGLLPPSISTIHSWRMHVCPDADAQRLGLDEQGLPVGDSLAIGQKAYEDLSVSSAAELEAPELTEDRRSYLRHDRYERAGIAYYEPSLSIWWVARPHLEESFQVGPTMDDPALEWWFTVAGSLKHEEFCRRVHSSGFRVRPESVQTKELAWGLLAYREKMLPHIIPIRTGVPSLCDSDFARSLADIVIGAYAAARAAPGGAIDLDEVINRRLNGKPLKATAACHTAPRNIL